MQKHTIESLKELVNTLRTERNNFRAMYENAKDRKHIARLEKKIAEQAEVIKLQNEAIRLFQEQTETFKLRIDELELMVFGKHHRKNKNPPGGGSGIGGSGTGTSGSETTPSPREKRPPFSFRRKTPEAKDITEVITHPLTECPDCKSTLQEKKVVERYSEDIPSLEEIQALLHRVTKRSIETGYCPCCKKQKSAIPIEKHVVGLGKNIRRFICYSTIIQNQSYSQVVQFISDMFGIAISDGEIVNILEGEKMKLVGEYEDLKERIRNGAVVHFDETGWPVVEEEQGNYAWAITNPGRDSEVAFLAGRSRGKGNAEELRGKDPSRHIGISDDYAAYKNTFTKHGLCWAHPLRKFRDLKDSPSLEPKQRKHCTKTYEDFAKTYASLEKTLEEENENWRNTGEWRIVRICPLEAKLRVSIRKLAIIKKGDPKKLQTLKESLQKNEDKYFTCLSGPGIPADNNKAERTLRHIVLKRRMSHGSKTQKGADVFAVLASVLLSLKAKYPGNFFAEYHKLMESLG